MKKRLLNLLFVFALAVILIPVMALRTQALSGMGTEKDPLIVKSYYELQQAMEKAPTDGTPFYIALGKDISANDNLSDNSISFSNHGQYIVLDLAGWTLSRHCGATADKGVIEADVTSTLIINDSVGDGAVKASGELPYAIAIGDDKYGSTSNVVINDGYFSSTQFDGAAIYVNNSGTCVINDGCFCSEGTYQTAVFDAYDLTINGGWFYAPENSINVPNPQNAHTIKCRGRGTQIRGAYIFGTIDGSGTLGNYIPQDAWVDVDGEMFSRNDYADKYTFGTPDGEIYISCPRAQLGFESMQPAINAVDMVDRVSNLKLVKGRDLYFEFEGKTLDDMFYDEGYTIKEEVGVSHQGEKLMAATSGARFNLNTYVKNSGLYQIWYTQTLYLDGTYVTRLTHTYLVDVVQGEVTNAQASVAEPILGTKPVLTGTGETGYDVVDVQWYYYDGIARRFLPMTKGMTFQANEDYQCTAELKAKSTHVFPENRENFTCTVNGIEAQVSNDYSLEKAIVTFKTKAVINSIDVVGLDGPIVGNAPMTTATLLPEGVSFATKECEMGQTDIQWMYYNIVSTGSTEHPMAAGETFSDYAATEGDQPYYFIYFAVKKPAGVDFSKNLNVTVNGEPVDVSEVAEGDYCLVAKMFGYAQSSRCPVIYTKDSLAQVGGAVAVDLEAMAESSEDFMEAYFNDDVSIQWYRYDKQTKALTAISGATGTSYTLTDQDAGKMVRAQVTYGDIAVTGSYFDIPSNIGSLIGQISGVTSGDVITIALYPEGSATPAYTQTVTKGMSVATYYFESVKIGTYTIKVSADGYKAYSAKVTIVADGLHTHDVQMETGSVNNGLMAVDGVWGYYEGGVLQTDFTGLVPYGDLIFYVENGILDFTYTGLAWYNDAWTYVANSQLTQGYTGLVWFNDNWFYVVDSIIDWTFTGLVPYEGNYFYVQNNLLDWSYTGLGYHDGGWYFIQNGLLQKNYSGLVYFNDNWFYVEEGVLTYQYFGMVEYEGNLFYVQASHLDWNYTGLGYHEGAWYYFQNALYTPSFTGLVPFNGALFYVKGGTIDWTYNGTAVYEGVTYTVKDGAVVL